jgi:nucleoside-diphosphate-sugar epimerase
MSALSVLFIGGTGVISSACSRAAVDAGHQLTLLRRGSRDLRAVPADVEVLTADVGDPDQVREALGSRRFDVVVSFLVFRPEQARADIETLRGRTDQYVFISSASAYQTPPARLPLTESTPLRNPFSDYSSAKIACEQVFVDAYRSEGFPVTIVRPSHTYDPTHVPLHGGWTDVARMRAGKPVFVHGDGTSLWTLTHHEDFAAAFVPLLGLPQVVGDSVHITSDEVLTWNQVYRMIGAAAGVPDPLLVPVTSERIAAAEPALSAPIIGDKAHSMVLDNSKVKGLVPGWRATVPFAVGARQIVDWYDADPARQVLDPEHDRLSDLLTQG